MSLEEEIRALTVALNANTAALTAAPKRGRPPSGGNESAPTSPVTQAATAPAASAATQTSAPVTQQPAAGAAANPVLLATTTEAVIKLANEYSREKAVGILSKRKVTRCSDLKPEDLQNVLNEANAEIAAADAAKTAATANASLV